MTTNNLQASTLFFRLLLAAVLFIYALCLLGLTGWPLVACSAIAFTLAAWCLIKIRKPDDFIRIENSSALFSAVHGFDNGRSILLSEIDSVSANKLLDTSGALAGLGVSTVLEISRSNGSVESVEVPFLCTSSYASKAVEFLHEHKRRNEKTANQSG